MNSPVIAAEPERRAILPRPAFAHRPVTRVEVTVLLVDDDVPTRRTMAYLLKRCTGLYPQLAVRCLETSSGVEGLELASDPDVKFVFLDYHMPDMTGLDFLAELLRRKPTMPVTLLTGDDHTNLAIEALRRGAYDVMLKVNATQDLLNHSLWKGLVWSEMKEQLLAQKAQLAQANLCVTLT